MKNREIYAAVKTDEQLKLAAKSGVSVIFCMQPNIKTLADTVKTAHSAGKRLFIHIDLAEGIGKDKYGIEYAKSLGVDGIISTRASIIKASRELGVFTVQRFFAVDSQAISTTAESVKSAKPDMIELMPGIAAKAIEKIGALTSVPIIAGGLIETEDEVNAAFSAGAVAVSTGKKELWEGCRAYGF